MKKTFFILFLALCFWCFIPGCAEKRGEPGDRIYAPGIVEAPRLSYHPPEYVPVEEKARNPEYALPLNTLPENYERDIQGKLGLTLTETQKQRLLNYGAVWVPGGKDRFEHAYRMLNESTIYEQDDVQKYDTSGIPIMITTDSILHLFHIEFNELLKNLEVNHLTVMLKECLDKMMEASLSQMRSFDDEELKELARRNVAYLSVARKLLEPSWKVPRSVRKDVEKEIERIDAHAGFFKNELFSADCPEVCGERLYPERLNFACSQEVKGSVRYNGKDWRFQDLYRDVCSRLCYCEDYSQYVPRGHYTASEELKQYFQAMIWLGRMTFKVRGEGWSKRAVLLTDAAKSSGAVDLWRKIYAVTGFFAGASDDLTFHEYDGAVRNFLGEGFDEETALRGDIAGDLADTLKNLRGPKILGGFEFDLAGNLKDTTQGLRLIGQRYALDSHILSDVVYSNVGPNPGSDDYERVVRCDRTTQRLSRPPEFYLDCENMAEDKQVYWNEVCSKAMEIHKYGFCGGLSEKRLYGVCRFMPTGLDVMSALGSETASNILEKRHLSLFCDYGEKMREMKELAAGYDLTAWTKNLYNTWLWMLQPVLEDRPEGYPRWMRTPFWKTKNLSTALTSWAELRHDTILYVKQSYTRAVMMPRPTAARPQPMASRYYGYVEPGPELFSRASFIVRYLLQGLKEQEILSPKVENVLERSREMMDRLKLISIKEIRGEVLEEADYRYIENIESVFSGIIEELASALTVEGEKPDGQVRTETTLVGKNEAFKTTIVADVHTETNTKKVLEVGSGKVDWVLVAHQSKDGRVGIAVGPVFSYYEFPHPMSDRLTNQKWREILETEPPSRPDWILEWLE